MYNNSLGNALAGFGENIGGMIRENRLKQEQNQDQAILQGLMTDYQNGNQNALLQLAQKDPNLARFASQMQMQQQEQARYQQEQDVNQLSSIAYQASKLKTPREVRAFLLQQANASNSQNVKDEIMDSLNMDDEGMMNDIRTAVTQGFGVQKETGMTEYQRANLALQERRLEQENTLTPSQRENLRLQQERLDFDRAQAKQERAGLQNAVDSMDLPDEDKETLKALPTKTLEKLVSQENSPKEKARKAEAQQQEVKAQEVTNKTKSLVTELLKNKNAIKSVVGGVDEMLPTLLPSSRDAEAALDDLKNILTVENLDLMTGVLSESDIKILKSVGASGLSGSQDRVIQTLEKMGKALGVDMGGDGRVGRFKMRIK